MSRAAVNVFDPAAASAGQSLGQTAGVLTRLAELRQQAKDQAEGRKLQREIAEQQVKEGEESRKLQETLKGIESESFERLNVSRERIATEQAEVRREEGLAERESRQKLLGQQQEFEEKMVNNRERLTRERREREGRLRISQIDRDVEITKRLGAEVEVARDGIAQIDEDMAVMQTSMDLIGGQTEGVVFDLVKGFEDSANTMQQDLLNLREQTNASVMKVMERLTTDGDFKKLLGEGDVRAIGQDILGRVIVELKGNGAFASAGIEGVPNASAGADAFAAYYGGLSDRVFNERVQRVRGDPNLSLDADLLHSPAVDFERSGMQAEVKGGLPAGVIGGRAGSIPSGAFPVDAPVFNVRGSRETLKGVLEDRITAGIARQLISTFDSEADGIRFSEANAVVMGDTTMGQGFGDKENRAFLEAIDYLNGAGAEIEVEDLPDNDRGIKRLGDLGASVLAAVGIADQERFLELMAEVQDRMPADEFERLNDKVLKRSGEIVKRRGALLEEQRGLASRREQFELSVTKAQDKAFLEGLIAERESIEEFLVEEGGR